jgi:hypothetical protein
VKKLLEKEMKGREGKGREIEGGDSLVRLLLEGRRFRGCVV